MKYYILFLISFQILGSSAFAQEKSFNTGFGFGGQVVQYQRDFGVGLNFTSPMFANERMGIRLKTNMMFNENVIGGNTEWNPYMNVSLGMMSVAGQIGDRIRLYGEGGVIGIIPNQRFSDKSFNMGGYGLFGFEFFFDRIGNYYIEIGGVGTGAHADRVASNPIYSNGLSVSAGFRFMLK